MAVGPGTILLGKYRIVECLASGGMGTVWRARDLGPLGRDVAIKVMRDQDASPQSMERFRREAKVAAGLDHQGIIQVYDADWDDGQFFIVMQLLKGKDLKEILKQNPGGIPVSRAVNFMIQAVEALAFAHENGVFHRDLKPANLFVQASDRLKICDFGIAKRVDATKSITAPGQWVGTPAYMSPEQWTGSGIDGRSDLYSLGCVLYEMLTSRPPFASDNIHVLMASHIGAVPAPPHGVRPVPRPLSDLVLRMMAKDPRDRPATATVVATALKGLDLSLVSGAFPDTVTSPRESASAPGALPNAAKLAGAGAKLWEDPDSEQVASSEPVAPALAEPAASAYVPPSGARHIHPPAGVNRPEHREPERPAARRREAGRRQAAYRRGAKQWRMTWKVANRVIAWSVSLTMLMFSIGVAFNWFSQYWLWMLVPGIFFTSAIAGIVSTSKFCGTRLAAAGLFGSQCATQSILILLATHTLLPAASAFVVSSVFIAFAISANV